MADEQAALIVRIRDLGQARVSYGCRRPHVLFWREVRPVNQKRVDPGCCYLLSPWLKLLAPATVTVCPPGLELEPFGVTMERSTSTSLME